MKKIAHLKRMRRPLVLGIIVGLIAMLVTVGLGLAAPLPQDTQPLPDKESPSCGGCHPNVENAWSHSPHAHAFDDQHFQERWSGLGEPSDCLLCHTTNFQATSETYSAEGVACEACHGQVDPNHPPAAVPIRADTEYCGTCHTTTLGEWRLTGHANAGVGCTDCHDPHSQQALFEDPDQMCINCHKDSMEPYLEDTHQQKGIGCVDCHSLVIPPETPPVDGIVPTGHTFTITPATCVACHTDALHAGFSLPGYENGAKQAKLESQPEQSENVSSQETLASSPAEQILLLENQVEALRAANANRIMTYIFQGGIVGLVLGGSTAWVVAHNVRRGRPEEEDNDEEEE